MQRVRKRRKVYKFSLGLNRVCLPRRDRHRRQGHLLRYRCRPGGSPSFPPLGGPPAPLAASSRVFGYPVGVGVGVGRPYARCGPSDDMISCHVM